MGRSRLLFLIVITYAIAFSFQGSIGLFETTEGRYAEISREMLETNNWLTPTLDYKPHWTKPPAIYWCLALSMKLFGVSTWSVRVCNSIFYCIIILLIVYLSWTLWGGTASYISGLIGSTGLFLVIGLQSISTDLLLSLWELLSVVSYWKAIKQQSSVNRKLWLVILWFSTGAAFLTKGPPGLLTLLCILIFNYIQKARGKESIRLFWIPALGIAMFTGLVWYITVVIENPALLHYYFTDEIAGRILTSQHHRNPSWYAPLYIYILPLMFSLGPWSYFWINAMIIQRKFLKLFKRQFYTQLSSEENFLIIWFLLPLIILSFAKSRLILYMLPFFPSLILLTSRLILCTKPNHYVTSCRIICVCTAIIIITLKGILAGISSSQNMYQLFLTINTISSGNIYKYPVISLHNDKLYGLQFYLHGNLIRMDCSPQDTTSLVKLLNKFSGHKGYILIDNYPHKTVEMLLHKNNISYSSAIALNKYAIYCIFDKKGL